LLGFYLALRRDDVAPSACAGLLRHCLLHVLAPDLRVGRDVGATAKSEG
jgi:hypothetical protein